MSELLKTKMKTWAQLAVCEAANHQLPSSLWILATDQDTQIQNCCAKASWKSHSCELTWTDSTEVSLPAFQHLFFTTFISKFSSEGTKKWSEHVQGLWTIKRNTIKTKYPWVYTQQNSYSKNAFMPWWIGSTCDPRAPLDEVKESVYFCFFGKNSLLPLSAKHSYNYLLKNKGSKSHSLDLNNILQKSISISRSSWLQRPGRSW